MGTIRDEVGDWHYDRFGQTPLSVLAAKLAEETGEVCAELVRVWETDGANAAIGPSSRAVLLDELGDVAVVLQVLLAQFTDLTLDEVLTTRFDEVRRR